MGLKLEQVVPWGRSLEEYSRMFDLTENDIQGQILDCAAGPASFNAQMTRQGHNVISCDPLYQFSVTEIARRIEETYPIIINGLIANQDKYVWQDIQSPTQLGKIRMAAMQQFLEDFPLGLQQGRYRTNELPTLPFDASRFDLALCSHFLFTYSDHFSMAFHLEAIMEMCRVAKQVRIFPLLNISGEPSPFVEPVAEELEKQGYTVQLKQVPYEFQKGGNQVLQVHARGRELVS
ncbi:MAG: SAM-dependent methyltransferase [Coleofasciculus sp. Co-bin14]|nr:SAM-dependent methyltransferase [Coleofasciculus sp. Co-bin14]